MKAKFFGGIADGQSMEVDTNNIVISVNEYEKYMKLMRKRMEKQNQCFLPGDSAPVLPSFVEHKYQKERWRMQTSKGVLEWIFYTARPQDLEAVELQIIRLINSVFETEGKKI